MKKIAILGVLAALATTMAAVGVAQAGFFGGVKSVVRRSAAAAKRIATKARRVAPLSRVALLQRLRANAAAIRARLRAARMTSKRPAAFLRQGMRRVFNHKHVKRARMTVRQAVQQSARSVKKLFRF